MSDDWVPTVEQIRLFKEAEAAYGDEAVFNEIAGRLHEQLGRKFWEPDILFCSEPTPHPTVGRVEHQAAAYEQADRLHVALALAAQKSEN